MRNANNEVFSELLVNDILRRVALGTRMNAMLEAREGSCHVVDAFLTLLKLIWPISSLKISSVQKMRFWQKAARVNGLTKKLAF